MAIKQKTDMAQIPVQQPPATPIISPVPSGSGTNIEAITSSPLELEYSSSMVENELAVLQNLKNAQLDLENSPAVQHIAGTKTRTIFFNQVNPIKNNDRINITSPNSVNGTKYNRIDNLLIVTDGELSMSFAMNDGRVENDISATGVIYPGSITPYPSDLFFAYGEMNVCTLYIITAVEPIYNTAETGFKINFKKHYEQFDPDQMINLTAGNFVFNFESLGTGKKSVIEKEIYLTYKTLDDLFNVISEEYCARFFNRGKNIIEFVHKIPKKITQYIDLATPGETISTEQFGESLPADSMHFFDPYVIEFLSKAFPKTKLSYQGFSICPMVPVWIDDSFYETYKFTVYNAILRRKPDLIKFKYMYPIRFQKRTMRDLIYDGWYYFEPVATLGDKCIDVYPPSFLSRMASNLMYSETTDNPEHVKYNVLIKFINTQGYIPKVSELKPFIENIESIPDNELYGIAPLMLYICDYYREILLKKTY